MSAVHGAARRLAGLLNDAAGAGVSISQEQLGEFGESTDDYEVYDDKLKIVVSLDKAGKWVVEDG